MPSTLSRELQRGVPYQQMGFAAVDVRGTWHKKSCIRANDAHADAAVKQKASAREAFINKTNALLTRRRTSDSGEPGLPSFR